MLHICAALGVTEEQVKDLTLMEGKEETHTLHLTPLLQQLFVVVLVLFVLFFLHFPSKTPLLNESVFQHVPYGI